MAPKLIFMLHCYPITIVLMTFENHHNRVLSKFAYLGPKLEGVSLIA